MVDGGGTSVQTDEQTLPPRPLVLSSEDDRTEAVDTKEDGGRDEEKKREDNGVCDLEEQNGTNV